MRLTIGVPRRRRSAPELKTALALHVKALHVNAPHVTALYVNALLGPAGDTPTAGLDVGYLLARDGLDDVAVALREVIHATLTQLAQHRGPTGHHRGRPDGSPWPSPLTTRTTMHDPLTPAPQQRGPVATSAAGTNR